MKKETKKELEKNKKKHQKTVKESKGKKIMRDLDKENSVSLSKAIVVLLIVIFIVGTVYFVSAVVMGEISFKDKTEQKEIQYENILVGSTFKQHDKEYIVVYYDFEGDDQDTIDTAIKSYKEKESAKAVYKVDLSLSQNKKYTTDKASNKKPKNAKELKIKGTTLVSIKDGKVNAYLESATKIKDYLK